MVNAARLLGKALQADPTNLVAIGRLAMLQVLYVCLHEWGV